MFVGSNIDSRRRSFCFYGVLGLYSATAVPGGARYLILCIIIFDIDAIIPSLEGVLKNDTTIDEATLQRSTELAESQRDTCNATRDKIPQE